MLNIALVIGGVFLLAWVVGFVAARRLERAGAARELRADDDHPVPEPPPRVSILVPARDEARGLDACLRSLRAQDYPSLEIVVLDDRSSDATPEILARHAAQDPRVVALTGAEPPAGWFGKPNAIRQCAERATGEWLLLTDADTIHAPASVRAGLAFAIRSGVRATSLSPRIVPETWFARLVSPHVLVFLGVAYLRARPRGAGRFEDDAARDQVSGGYILVHRSSWEAVGGMSHVKDDLAEDLALARRLAASPGGYRAARGAALWSTPAYRTWAEFRRGYARNPLLGFEGRLLRGILNPLLLVFTAVYPAALALACAVLLARGATPTGPLVFGVAAWGAIAAMQARLRAKLGVRWYESLLSPVGALLAGPLLLTIFFDRRRGRAVAWKGRDYPRPS